MSTAEDGAPAGLRRRTFVGYVIGGSTLAVAADLAMGKPARADGVPSPPQLPETYDLEDLQTDAAAPTSQLITIEIGEDGIARFAIPRMEVGQGITTSTAMIIAEELDLPLEHVEVSLAPARPELMFNQLTGGSNTSVSTYTPIRVAAAVARRALLAAAAAYLDYSQSRLRVLDGVIAAPDGTSVTFGELAPLAASPTTEQVEVGLEEKAEKRVIGTPRNRVDALEAVTGRKAFSMDLDVEGALPTMVCRPPTLFGSPERLNNEAEIMAMPGVEDIAVVDTGVAVRARTFGQCIDAIMVMDVDWAGGPIEGESDQTILARVKKAEVPLAAPKVPLLAQQIDAEFEFMFRSSAALEPNCAIADVREDEATIWSGLKVPILCQQNVAKAVGLPQEAVTVNVITGGGSFGHKLFGDVAIEAAEISQAMGKPVKLMWHRGDEPRQGRLHPLCTSRIRATILGKDVLTFEQRHTSVNTDFSHGLGEMLTSMADELPTGLGGLGFSQSIFTLTQELPYDFGAVTQLLNETDDRFPTGSMRNIYSPDVRVANELVVDMLAQRMGIDPLEFRIKYTKSPQVRKVLEKVAEESAWGKQMPTGMAQGVSIHREYRGATACVVELDCRPQTVNRKIRNAVTGPRVTKGTFAVDAGLVLNPRGLEAQMQGGFADGLALTLTSSCHLRDGHFLEASWDNYFYTRQWNMPPEFDVHIVDSDATHPGGAGEAGVAASAASVACAYARVTGTVPKRFPINHNELSFEPYPFEPPIPQSPTNGLEFTY